MKPNFVFMHFVFLYFRFKNEIVTMTTPIAKTATKEDGISDTVDHNDLDQLTDEELYRTLQKLEQEKELLAQQQLLKEIEKLQNELKIHEKRKAERQKAPGTFTPTFCWTMHTRSNMICFLI